MSRALRLEGAEFVKSGTLPSHYPPGDHPEVAFAGRSNVGKSSLFNALCSRTLARTSATPGRTRLLNFFSARLLGKHVSLVDLPGYGYAKVSKTERAGWRQMIDTYVRAREHLCAIVVIVDARRGAEAEEEDLLAWLGSAGIRPIVVATKLDKLGKAERYPALNAIKRSLGLPRPPLGFSAETGEGKDELMRALASALIDSQRTTSPASESEQ